SFPFEQIVAYYAIADLMWITPLRDGLNLVTKEYVATHGLNEGAGVLVLSEFAGAAAELHAAILTNPHDPKDLRDKLYFGISISLSRGECAARLREIFDVVRNHDVHRWGAEFLEAVDASARPSTPEDTASAACRWSAAEFAFFARLAGAVHG